MKTVMDMLHKGEKVKPEFVAQFLERTVAAFAKGHVPSEKIQKMVMSHIKNHPKILAKLLENSTHMDGSVKAAFLEKGYHMDFKGKLVDPVRTEPHNDAQMAAMKHPAIQALVDQGCMLGKDGSIEVNASTSKRDWEEMKGYMEALKQEGWTKIPDKMALQPPQAQEAAAAPSAPTEQPAVKRSVSNVTDASDASSFDEDAAVTTPVSPLIQSASSDSIGSAVTQESANMPATPTPMPKESPNGFFAQVRQDLGI
jgi:hypothetical protein